MEFYDKHEEGLGKMFMLRSIESTLKEIEPVNEEEMVEEAMLVSRLM